MEQEIGQLNINGILCRICTSPRRKRAAFVADEKTVTLCGPPRMTLQDAEKILQANQQILQRLLRRQKSLPLPVPPPEFAIGGTLRFLGASCPVERGFGPPRFADGVFSVHPVYARTEEFLKLYRKLALKILELKVARTAQTANVVIAGIHVGNAARRWGSCTADGHLHFTWKLVLCPEPLIDYVVAHEVAHRLHMDHSPAFWDQVADLCPDWERRRKELRREEQKLRSWADWK